MAKLQKIKSTSFNCAVPTFLTSLYTVMEFPTIEFVFVFPSLNFLFAPSVNIWKHRGLQTCHPHTRKPENAVLAT